MASNNNFYALGRRKSATARVRLQSGKGQLLINQKSAEAYLGASKSHLSDLLKPFHVLELDPAKFDVSLLVSGGGHAGQIDASKLAIAKALSELNEDYKGTLKKAQLLGRDPREKERKKFGLKGARKKRQFTKR